MEVSHLVAVLADLDMQERKPYLQATSIEYLGNGGSEAWRCKAGDGETYVVKVQNNGQDLAQLREPGHPLKILTTELICGRLGQLFHPAACPEVAIIDIPEKLASGTTFPHTNRPIAAGPSFGSLLYPETVDIKFQGNLDLVPLEQIARIIVFQTWLRGADIAALVTLDGRKALSIDHGFYLAGTVNWEIDMLNNPSPVIPVQIPSSHHPIASSVFQVILKELHMFNEFDILTAFSSIPQEWGGTIEFRANLAYMVLQRRSMVEQALSKIWKEVPIW